ncbi:hypothetical protein [Azospirillum sp. TSO5]|uniref:hypothetical protein n=1 Tax=Azospirillum sp. TSO5 TaxID=716760 RepID=UPI000D618E0A|nr:hypothetical protein [Azospirillum sp. TSO5]PWC96976.1 hypothetical protein TSO5_05980 [Azospirillum sp. TSO5]
MSIELDWQPSNRDKVMTPRSRSAWCRCDGNHIHDGERCEVCGRRSPKRRLKMNRRNATLVEHSCF